jgi:hypothetical protein
MRLWGEESSTKLHVEHVTSVPPGAAPVQKSPSIGLRARRVGSFLMGSSRARGWSFLPYSVVV